MSVHSSEVSCGPNDHPGHDHRPREDEDKDLKVFVIYNGVTEKIEFEFEETLGVLRQRALAKFGNIPQPHTLSFFTSAGIEFGPDRDAETIRHAGIERNEKLLLRPGVVRGGLE